MSLLRKSVLLVILELIILTLAGFSISVILARTLGPEGLGDWKLIMSMQNISLYILGFGLSIVVTRYTAEFIKDQRYSAVMGILYRSLSIVGLATIIAGVVYVSLLESFEIKATTAILTTDIAIFVVVALTINMINDILGRAFLTGLKRRDLVSIVQITGRGLFLFAVITLWIIGEINIRNAIYILIVAYMIELGIYCYLFLKQRKSILSNGKGVRFTKEDSHRIVRFARYQWLFKMAQLFREYSVDNYMLLIFKGVASVGIYGAAITVPILLRQVSPAKLFAGILIPYFVPKRDEHIKNIKERIGFYFSIIQKFTAITIWPMAFIGIVFAEDIIVLIFGYDFVKGVMAMQILISFMLVQTAADIFYHLAVAIEESRLMFLTSLWGIANVVVNLVFIPLWGVTGAAIGTGMMSIAIYVHFKYMFSKKGWFFFYPWKDALKVVVSLLPLIFLIFIAKIFDKSLLFEFVLLLFGLVFYVLILRKYSPFNKIEKNIIHEQFGKPAILIINKD